MTSSPKRERKKNRSNQADSLFHQSCALHRDTVLGDLFSINELLAAKADVNEANKAGSTALHFAAQNGQTNVAVRLMFAQANPSLCNKFNDSPLHIATKRGYDEIVYHLLRNKSVVDLVNSQELATPLYYAVTKGFSECVRLLVRAGADPHFIVGDTGMSIVQMACNGNNVETLRQLIEVVNVNAAMQNGRTALHWACYYGKMAFVRQLVTSGANVNISDEEGCTPLFWAVYSGHANVVRHLLRHGADSQATASDGSRPIHWAATYNHAIVADLLLTDDCDVNATYNQGMTALHHAADFGFDQITTVLLLHKADAEMPVRNQTALDLATAKGHKRVVKLLTGETTIYEAHEANIVSLDQLSVEEIAGFLSVKHLTMYVDKFVDLQLDGAKIAEIFKTPSNAKVFLKTISKDTIRRFKELCVQGMYNISDFKRGNYSRVMKGYEGKLTTCFQHALAHGVNNDEINDEAFSLHMERDYEARRLFQEVDVDNSGLLDRDEVAALADSIGFKKKAVDLYMSEFDVNNDGQMSVDEFVEFFNQMRGPNVAVKKKLDEKISSYPSRHSSSKSQRRTVPKETKSPTNDTSQLRLPAL